MKDLFSVAVLRKIRSSEDKRRSYNKELRREALAKTIYAAVQMQERYIPLNHQVELTQKARDQETIIGLWRVAML